LVSRARDGLGVGIGLLLLAIYLFTLCPTIEVGDSGELTTAAASLGIAHPPGYPLWCLATHPFTRLPLDPAVGANLASAVFSALASIVFFRVASGPLAIPLALAVPLTLVHGLGPVLWSQSVYAEVYALNLAVVLLAWLFEAEEPRFDAIIPFWLGLVLVSHGTNAPLVAFLGFRWVWRQRREPDRRRRWLAGVAIAVLGLLPILYLPLRARANPVLDWGHPADLESLVAHLTRRQYGGVEWAGAAPFSTVFAKLWGGLLASGSFLGVGLALAVSGWERHVRAVRLAGVSLILTGPLTALLAAGSLGGRQLDESEVFFIPATSFFLVLAGRAFGRWRRVRPAAVAALSLWAIVLFVRERPHADKSGNFVALDYANALLTPLPAGSVLFVDADHEALPLVYLQGVRRTRTDVSVRLLEGPRDRDIFGKRVPPWRGPQGGASAPPLFVTVPKAEFAEMPLVPQGLAFRAGDAGAEPAWAPVVLRRKPDTRATAFERTAEASVRFHEAAAAFARGEPATARAALLEGERLVTDQERMLSDLGVLAASNGFTDDARRLWRRAIEINPRYTLAVRNLLELELQSGDRAAARRVVDRALDANREWREMQDWKARLGSP
jgi:hypothetical protein